MSAATDIRREYVDGVWVIEEGYYEDRSVIGVATTKEGAEQLAESIHPVHDTFFGTDPICQHYHQREVMREGLVDPMRGNPNYIECGGCTVSLTRWDLV